jgi:tetratricopeptide (TPR) repeat protein
MYADFLDAMGRAGEAEAQHRRAVEIDPLNLISNTNLGDGLYNEHKYDQAIEQYQKTLALDANFSVALAGLGSAYERKGMYKEAISEWQKMLAAEQDAQTAALLGNTYARSGYKDAMRAWIADLKKQSADNYVSPFGVAQLYAMLGEKDSTMEWLEKAYQDRSVDLVTVNVDPVFDFLHSDRRFQDLLRRIGLTPADLARRASKPATPILVAAKSE